MDEQEFNSLINSGEIKTEEAKPSDNSVDSSLDKNNEIESFIPELTAIRRLKQDSDSVPTHTPKNFIDQFYLYLNGSTRKLYVWINKGWLALSAGVTAHGDLTGLDADDHPQYVETTGDETILGVKTFDSIPVGPASDPTTATQLTRKSYVDNLAGTKVGTGYTDVAVQNTTTETTLMTTSITGGTLSTNNAIQSKMHFTLNTNIAGGVNRTFRFKYGTTTIATIVIPLTLGNTDYEGYIYTDLIGAGGASAQEGNMQIIFVETANTANIHHYIVRGTGAESSASTLNMLITLQYASAEANETFTMRHYIVNKVK